MRKSNNLLANDEYNGKLNHNFIKAQFSFHHFKYQNYTKSKFLQPKTKHQFYYFLSHLSLFHSFICNIQLSSIHFQTPKIIKLKIKRNNLMVENSKNCFLKKRWKKVKQALDYHGTKFLFGTFRKCDFQLEDF